MQSDDSTDTSRHFHIYGGIGMSMVNQGRYESLSDAVEAYLSLTLDNFCTNPVNLTKRIEIEYALQHKFIADTDTGIYIDLAGVRLMLADCDVEKCFHPIMN